MVFLVGAALSQPEGDDPGVPGVDGVIEEIREIIRLYKLDERFESALANSGDGRSRYQRAMEFLSQNLGPERVQSVIVRSVQKARKPSRDLENDVDYWHLNSGTAALGQIISKHRDRFAPFQLTVNFDPLLHVAIRRAGGQPTFSVLNVDGTLPDEEGEVPDSVRIVNHGSVSYRLNAGLLRGGSNYAPHFKSSRP